MASRGRFRRKKDEASVDAIMSGDEEPAAETPTVNEEDQKATVIGDYEKSLKAVRELNDMTKMPAWQKFYAGLQTKKRNIKDKFDEIEKPREIVKAQMKIKAIAEVQAEVKAPVEAMMAIISNYPLFAPSMKTRAQWDENSGRVTLVENS